MKRVIPVVLSAVLLSSGSGIALASQGQAASRGVPFAQPPGTVAVSFVVDDSANRVYGDGDLKWKGSFLLDTATRILAYDPYWSGAAPGAEPLSGWPTLYDDGPWTAGGHEPAGARAGDHLWGVTVFVVPPASGSLTFMYGLTDAAYEAALGNGWIWKGPNGTFTVDAGATEPIDSAGMIFPRFGRVDLQLRIDTGALAPGWPFGAETVTVKSSAWGWGEISMRDEGGGKFALELAPLIGKKGLLPHTGLLSPGDTPEFVFVLGGYEYFVWDQLSDGTWYLRTDGMSAGTATKGDHGYIDAPIEVSAVNWNPFVTIPACDGTPPYADCRP